MNPQPNKKWKERRRISSDYINTFFSTRLGRYRLLVSIRLFFLHSFPTSKHVRYSSLLIFIQFFQVCILSHTCKSQLYQALNQVTSGQSRNLYRTLWCGSKVAWSKVQRFCITGTELAEYDILKRKQRKKASISPKTESKPPPTNLFYAWLLTRKSDWGTPISAGDATRLFFIQEK